MWVVKLGPRELCLGWVKGKKAPAVMLREGEQCMKNVKAAVAAEIANSTSLLEDLDLSDEEYVLVLHADSTIADDKLPAATPRGPSSEVDLVPLPKSTPEPFKQSKLHEPLRIKVSLMH
jgi:hypothetical protein